MIDMARHGLGDCIAAAAAAAAAAAVEQKYQQRAHRAVFRRRSCQ